MKKRAFAIALAICAMTGVWAQSINIDLPLKKDVKGRAMAGFQPAFYLFPDQAVDSVAGKQLADDLGITTLAIEQAGSLCIVNPTGATWSGDDVEAFKQLLATRAVTNVKVIALGKGATFVNKQLATSDLAGAIAGIVSIDGAPGKVGSQPVPAYVAGKGAASAAKAYVKQDDARLKVKGVTSTYVNDVEPLLQVVVNTGKASNAELVADAWDKVLSANYRFNNLYRTWYTTRGVDNPEGVKNFELVDYTMVDKLGIERNVVEYQTRGKDSKPEDTFLWYEYLPQQVKEAPKGSVPLMVLLHGNNNDPRTQSETSGFVELAAEEGFMVVEMEWQGNGYGFMGLDGIENVINLLLEKYPQLDGSRIYSEGLSAGSMTSSAIGIKKSYLFAAVGGHSGGIFPGSGMMFYSYGMNQLNSEATQKRGFVEMPYCSVCGTDDEVVRFVKEGNYTMSSIYNAWLVYQNLNGMELVKELDFGKDATFGLELKDREVIHTGKGEDITVEMGQLYKGEIPMIRMIAVDRYGHWNFKPTARLMWDFFKHFSRDPETKKLIYKG